MPTQHQRMMELMGITNFFAGANSGFVNKFNGSRMVAHNNWLDDNVNRNPQAVKRYEEIRQEISLLESCKTKLRRRQEETNRNDLDNV